jgi:hypothetical protein
MNKKPRIIIILSIVLSIFFSSFALPSYPPIVRAETVSNVTENVGVVTTIIEFDSSDTTSTYRIYFSTSSGITTSNDHTYRDPDDRTSNQDDTHRRMVIMGLQDNTTYYYRIRNIDTGLWKNDESNFTTNPRFNSTIPWKDEFYDTYYTDASNNIELVQEDGIKYDGNPIIPCNAIAGTGQTGPTEYGYCCPVVHKQSDTEWHMWGFNFSSYVNPWYATSTDGLTWALSNTKISYDQGTESIYPNFMYYNNTWRSYYGTHIPADPNSGQAYATASSASGPYTYIDTVFIRGWVSGTTENLENLFSGIHYDPYSPFLFLAYGQHQTTGGSYTRDQGRWWAFNLTDWISFYYDNSIADTSPRDGTVNIPLVSGFTGQYMSEATVRSGIYVGCVKMFASQTNKVTYLMVSRNQWDWELFNSSKPLIEAGASGTWDSNMRRMGWGTPETPWIFTHNGMEWMYYFAQNLTEGNYDNRHAVGLIRWREDGITSATSTDTTAYLRTTEIPINFTANFTVNGNFSGTAKLNISIINPTTGTTYSGFANSDFDTITTNSTSLSPTWGTKTLDDVRAVGNAFKINFSFDGTGGKLFSYSIDWQGQEGFISIAGASNESTIYDRTPTFNWSAVSGAFLYQLQVANDTAFTDLVVNLNDINATNYPSHYSESGGVVSFILPDANDLTYTNKTYYTRFRASIVS